MVLGGCVRTKPSKFYRLNAVSGSGPGAKTIDTGGELAIGVGPVKLPLYLDRPHIVTRTRTNEFDSSGFDRWAEPLKNNITNVLAENLSVLLATDRITVFPWTGATELDYQVLVEVIRFEGKPGGNVEVGAQWIIFGGKEDNKELLTNKSLLSGSSGDESYEAIVAAQSRLLGDLNAEIAAGIQGLSQERVE